MKKNYLLSAKCLIATIIAFLGISHANAYNNLSVNNPHGWEQSQGTIERASFVVEPKGLYMECEMELTLSAAGTNLYKERYQLEIVLDFELPGGSMITEAYLLIEDSLVKARLKEKWVAETIYENIVNRGRRDPLLLTKTSEVNYTAKIYPMVGNTNRTFKIKYLTPASWFVGKASIPIPTKILNTSFRAMEGAPLIVKTNSEWGKPEIQNHPEIGFEKIMVTSNNSTVIYKAILPYDKTTVTTYDLEFSSPLSNGIYFDACEIGDGGYYQLAVQPSNIIKDMDKETKTIYVKSYEIQVSTSNGFCHSKYDLNQKELDYIGNPKLQMGKYYGSFPITVEIAFMTNAGIFKDTILIEDSGANTSNGSIMLAWTGHTINNLENSAYDSERIGRIMDMSLQSGILSKYTAYIALEPGMSYELPDGEQGDNLEMPTAIIDFGRKPANKTQINPFPNPFRSALTINIVFDSLVDLEKVEAKIIGLDGKVLKIFDLDAFGFGKEISFEWNGETNGGYQLNKGVYVLCVSTPGKSTSIKIVKVD